jgi:hypothetical protein
MCQGCRHQLTLPGGGIDATGDPDRRAAHRNLAIALRDVFDSARRRSRTTSVAGAAPL